MEDGRRVNGGGRHDTLRRGLVAVNGRSVGQQCAVRQRCVHARRQDDLVTRGAHGRGEGADLPVKRASRDSRGGRQRAGKRDVGWQCIADDDVSGDLVAGVGIAQGVGQPFARLDNGNPGPFLQMEHWSTAYPRFDSLLQQIALGVGQPGGEIERRLVGKRCRDNSTDSQRCSTTLAGDIVHMPVPDVTDMAAGGQGSSSENSLGVEGSGDDDLGSVCVAIVGIIEGVGQWASSLHRVRPIGY